MVKKSNIPFQMPAQWQPPPSGPYATGAHQQLPGYSSPQPQQYMGYPSPTPQQPTGYPYINPQQPMGYPPTNSPGYQQPTYAQQPSPFTSPNQAQSSPYPSPNQAQTSPYLSPNQSQPFSMNRQLNVKNGGLAQPQIFVMDPATSMPLYTITNPKRETWGSSPPMIITSSSGASIGSITLHSSTTSDIDLVLHGQAIKFKGGSFKSSREMVSNMPGVGKLKWKNENVLKGGDMKCTAGNGEVLARLEAGKWGKVQKEGMFELGSSVAAGGPAMDEIVISGIAMVEHLGRHSGDGEKLDASINIISAVAGGGA